MPEFIKQHTLRLTPLSPIHIGCGTDVEPTQFVIDNQILYAFEPSQARLSERQRTKLLGLGKQADLLAIQRFFKEPEQIRTFKACAQEFIPVCKDIATDYERKLGEVVQTEATGNKVFNKFYFERTQYNPLSHEVLIPATSVKGALRTGLIDVMQAGRRIDNLTKSSALEKSHIGDFEQGYSRFIKIADFMPTRPVTRKINFAVNRKKEPKYDAQGQIVNAKGISSRKEVICPAQYRVFSSSVSVHHPHTDYQKWGSQLKEWAQDCNRYHKARFDEDIDILSEMGRGFGQKKWCDSTRTLIAQLQSELDAGRMILIRLGRHGGAESKVLSGGIARISIMQGKGKPSIRESQTKTIWLNSDSERAQTGMLPYGWALIEIDPAADNPALSQWCDHNQIDIPAPEQLKASVQADRDAVNAAYQAEQQERARLAQEQAAQLAAEQVAQAQREAKLSQLSEQARQIEEYREQLEAAPKPKTPGGPLYEALYALLERAQTWPTQDQHQLVDILRPMAKNKLYMGKAEKELKAAFNKLKPN